MAPRKEKQGIDIRGPLQIGGSSGTADDVLVGADGGFVPFATPLAREYTAIPPLGKKQRAPKKLLMLGLGNSNWLGQAGIAALDRDGVHAREAGLFEVSQGRNHGNYYGASDGELMQLRVPQQDNFQSVKNVGTPPFSPNPLTPGASLGRSGPKMAAMKRVKALLPEVEEIAILTCGIGTSGLVAIDVAGYRNVADWAAPGVAPVGQATLDLVTKANAFLAAHPDYECDWIAGQLGAVSGFAEESASSFRTNLLAMLAYIRANVTGASNAVFTMHSLHPQLVTDNVSATQGAGFGTLDLIEAEILTFASRDPLLRTAIIDSSSFTATDDGLHHTEADFTEIGRKHGEAYVAVRTSNTNAPALAECRFLPTKAGVLECALGSGYRIHDQVVEDDPIMGSVLRANPPAANQPAGFQTSVRLNNAAHTIFARVRFMQAPSGDRSLFAGKTPSQASYGRLVSLRRVSYEGSASEFDPQLETGKTSPLTQYKWHSVALTYDGTSMQMFRDGVATTVPQTNGAATIAQETALELMTYDNDNAAGAPGGIVETDARMTDIRVAPRALTAAEILEWHNDLPPAVDGAPGQRTTPDAVGSAISLGINPTAGNSWRDQEATGLYKVTYDNDLAGNPMNSTDDLLPWDPNLEGDGVSGAPVIWEVELNVLDATRAHARATTEGLTGNGKLYSRSWVAVLQKLSTSASWTLTGTPDWQELTDATARPYDYGVNPTGDSWRNQVETGLVKVTYAMTADGNPSGPVPNPMDSTDDGLPWNPNRTGGGILTAPVVWLIDMKVVNDTLAFAVATSVGIESNSGDFIPRSYLAYLTKADRFASVWTLSGTPDWQELTDGTFS